MSTVFHKAQAKLTCAAEMYVAALGTADAERMLARLERAARDYANALRRSS
jgi:hypothetical protein